MTISVPIKGDTIVEPDETFVDLSIIDFPRNHRQRPRYRHNQQRRWDLFVFYRSHIKRSFSKRRRGRQRCCDSAGGLQLDGSE